MVRNASAQKNAIFYSQIGVQIYKNITLGYNPGLMVKAGNSDHEFPSLIPTKGWDFCWEHIRDQYSWITWSSAQSRGLLHVMMIAPADKSELKLTLKADGWSLKQNKTYLFAILNQFNKF